MDDDGCHQASGVPTDYPEHQAVDEREPDAGDAAREAGLIVQSRKSSRLQYQSCSARAERSLK